MTWSAACFKSHTITSHTIAFAAITLAGLITTDEQVRDFLLSTLKAHPKLASDIVLLAGIILKYSRSTSVQGAAQNVVADAGVPPPASVTVKPLTQAKEPQ